LTQWVESSRSAWLRFGPSCRISIVAREKCLQDRQCGFIRGCGGKLEDSNGVGLRIIGTGFQQAPLQ
jgi:hypothetical protein